MSASASRIVDAILEDLTDRRGLRQEWDEIDDDIQAEIKAKWASLAERELSSAPALSPEERAERALRGLPTIERLAPSFGEGFIAGYLARDKEKI